MEKIVQEFSVPFRYPVIFTDAVFEPQNLQLLDVLQPSASSVARALVVLDAGVAQAFPHLQAQIETYFAAHAAHLQLVAPPIILPGGEAIKNDWQAVEHLMSLAQAQQLDRHSYVVAVGGGSLLDMAGLATALVHRGLRLVRIPTTVLAQNDAGVGVKNSMNFGGAKNFAGTFAPPFAVINDLSFLNQLPRREQLGGVAEAFKVAIIKDRQFFDYLATHAAAIRELQTDVMRTIVYRTAALHLHHIASSGDPFEFGSARPLDFGHWAAHQIERLSDFTIGHGWAVAMGIALDSTYAQLRGILSATAQAAILNALQACGLPLWHPLMARRDAKGPNLLLEGLEQFREHLGGELCITLPTALGAKCEVHTIDTPLMLQALAQLETTAG